MSRGGETGGPTIQDALTEFARSGYEGDFRAKQGGVLECLTCGQDSRAQDVRRTAMRRVEGASDPADMVSVNALVCPRCGAHGTLVLAYGMNASPEDAEVLTHLNSAHAKDHESMNRDLLHPAEAEVPQMPSETDESGLPGPRTIDEA